MRLLQRQTCWLLALLIFTGASTLRASPLAAGQPATAHGTEGMIAAAEPFAAEAGLEILREGGNAVDAAVAVGFALAVTHPSAGNLGGGGFMVIRMADGTAVMVDYRERAPAAAHWDMFLDAEGKLIPESSTIGWRASGVPGSVAGMELALRTHGTMSLAQVLKPAIRLAAEGFPVSERLAHLLREKASLLSRDPESRRIFLRNGKYYEPGERFVQKDLARTLKKIAEHGAKEFYEGSLARRLVRESKRGNGLFTPEDLSNYKAVLREPLRGSFHGHEIVTAAPPSSGGVALLEALNMLERSLAPGSAREDIGTLHLIAEVLRRAFADRARYLADPDFAEIPVAGLIDKAYAAAFADGINPRRASASAALERPDPLRFPAASVETSAGGPRDESHDTTHFSVIDAAGNAVANTTTINGLYGNGVTVPGLGFLLNNEMDDFTAEPGGANALFGMVQSDANKVEPGKRPLSSMTPTIVVKDGENILALGGRGGGRIISAVLQVTLNRVFFGDDLALAVARPRLHHQWMPDELVLEEGMYSREQIEALKALGHTVVFDDTAGRVNAVERRPASGELYGVADARSEGTARGY